MGCQQLSKCTHLQNKQVKKMRYHTHISGVRRESCVLPVVACYPNAEMSFNKRIVYNAMECSPRCSQV
ncbi:unnamed protein product [Lathyrus oleraceus]